MSKNVLVSELAAAQRSGALLVDVREPEEYRSGHVPGAVSIPLGVLPVRAHELARDAAVYLICQRGGRSSQAAEGLDRAGFDARSVSGGTEAWQAAGFPLASGPAPR